MGIRRRDAIQGHFSVDEKGHPTGGRSTGTGVNIDWQNGIVQDGVQNGAFVEDVIEAAIGRIEFFNSNGFRCRENSLAITKLEEALHWLDARTQARLDQGVENTYEQHNS